MTLESITAKTKVPVALWEALERNDFANWPSGLFARAYVRDYARMIGVDAEEVVEEFCRYFPNGDRRRGALLRAQAEIVDIRSQYHDDQMPADGDRRTPTADSAKVARFPRFASARTGQRVLGAVGDTAAVCLVALGSAQLLNVRFLTMLGLVCVAYYSVGFVIIGRSPGFALAQAIARRLPQVVHVRERRMHASS